MNLRGQFDALRSKGPAGYVHSQLHRDLPSRSGRKWLRRSWEKQHLGSPPFIALRALVPSGLACVLARPPYGEAQTAIWAARWAKLPVAVRRFNPHLSAGPLHFLRCN